MEKTSPSIPILGNGNLFSRFNKDALALYLSTGKDEVEFALVSLLGPYIIMIKFKKEAGFTNRNNFSLCLLGAQFTKIHMEGA